MLCYSNGTDNQSLKHSAKLTSNVNKTVINTSVLAHMATVSAAQNIARTWCMVALQVDK